ncbi:hypothetical protein M8C21_016311 [Ambrosia artemisiifolia]|uniref:Uncharacterized protein n=1 Tax=Ambrosia artemisiifolia TaxID=4212 RepID=A0AAD5CTY7_AMBAR|nr:hypothetical protein M8C21_016311 [Ambrosia artemisiifolia]
MSLHKIIMATIKFAFFLLTLSTLLQAYHARHLHDASMYGRPPLLEVVTEEKLQSPDHKSSCLESALSQGQTTFSLSHPKSPPSLEGVPLKTVEVIQMVTEEKLRSPDCKSSDLKSTLPEGQTTYGREDPQSPPSPKGAPPQVQTTYSRDNPYSPPSPDDAPSQGHIRTSK